MCVCVCVCVCLHVVVVCTWNWTSCMGVRFRLEVLFRGDDC